MPCIQPRNNKFSASHCFLHYFLKLLCMFNSISLLDCMRTSVVCEGCVIQLSVQHFRKKITNQVHNLHKLAKERAGNQAKITIRYLLKINVSIVITLTLVLNSSTGNQANMYLVTVQLLRFQVLLLLLIFVSVPLVLSKCACSHT